MIRFHIGVRFEKILRKGIENAHSMKNTKDLLIQVCTKKGQLQTNIQVLKLSSAKDIVTFEHLSF